MVEQSGDRSVVRSDESLRHAVGGIPEFDEFFEPGGGHEISLRTECHRADLLPVPTQDVPFRKRFEVPQPGR